MKYIGEAEYRHGTPSKLGVLLVNLGTPDDTSTPSVRRYLKQFLSDPRVVEVPRLLWWLILNGVILRLRPAKTAEAYKSVWDDEKGSPLLAIATEQAAAVKQMLPEYLPGRTMVKLAMRYGNPSIESALTEMRDANVRRLVVLPLYPQYSGSTVASVFDEVTRQLTKVRWIPELRFINQYFDQTEYIDALAASVRQHWQNNTQPQKLVMSYHGIPERYRTNGDPYFCQCQATSRMLAHKLSLSEEQFMVVFQSRFGREPWLQPYCDKTMESLPNSGVKSVDVICPGFSADCLETIEEINEENRDIFTHAGGEQFNYIPALNAGPLHIKALCSVIQAHAQGWPESGRVAESEQQLKETEQRALAMGAAC